jgi:RNA polymerase sigma-70 factor (ECF subfamily)
LSTVPAGGALGRFRLIPTRANGQPAFAFYLKDPQCPIHRATGIMVLTLDDDRIARITAFHDTAVFARFGLPRTLRH